MASGSGGDGETEDEGEVLADGEILGEGEREGLGLELGETDGLGLTLGDTEDEGEIAGVPARERISIVPVAVGPALERVRFPLDVAPPKLND